MASRFVKLTRAAMRALPAKQRICEHGIVYEKLPSGDGRFYVNLMIDGQRIFRSAGQESAGVTREQVEKLVEQLRSDARHERLNLPKGRKLRLTFKAAAKDYLAKLEESGGLDLQKKRYRLEKHLVPFFGDRPLDKLTSFDVERYKKHRADAGAAPGSVNRELATVSHLYSMAVEWKWLDHKPLQVKRLQEDKGRITYLTPEQIDRLLAAARNSDNPVLYPFVQIGLDTSMRRMEILSIRLEHISLDRLTIYVPEAKAGAREQPITPHLAEFLRPYVAGATPGQEWLFPAPRSRTGHAVSIEKAFRQAVTEAGMDPAEVVRHTLRHTAITHLVQAGVDLPAVKRVSGHKTLSMVERYSHQNGEHIRAAMEKLQARIHPATSGTVT